MEFLIHLNLIEFLHACSQVVILRRHFVEQRETA